MHPLPTDLAAIYAEHAAAVWRLAFRLGVRQADLEDVLHEVFLVVQRKLATYDGSAPLRSWLFGIATRVAAAHRRRAHVRFEAGDDALGIVAAPAQGQPDQEFSRRQAWARLDGILSALSDDARSVFVLFELEDLSCDDIARVLGIPTGTVYSRLHHARKRVAAAVAQLREQDEQGGTP